MDKKELRNYINIGYSGFAPYTEQNMETVAQLISPSISSFFKNGGKWQIECNLEKPHRAMSVQVCFTHDGQGDETEFSINSFDKAELHGLFRDFCKENNFTEVNVTGIYVVRAAETMRQLVEIEEDLEKE